MVRGQFKTNTFRKVFRRTPGAKLVVRFIKKKPARPKCPVTGTVLQGVPNGTPTQVRKLPKSQRRPNRPFGGVLSSKAARRELIARARK